MHFLALGYLLGAHFGVRDALGNKDAHLGAEVPCDQVMENEFEFLIPS